MIYCSKIFFNRLIHEKIVMNTKGLTSYPTISLIQFSKIEFLHTRHILAYLPYDKVQIESYLESQH